MPALDTPDIQEAFKIIGKLVHLHALADPQITAYKKASTALGDQILTGTSDEFALADTVYLPVHAAVKSLVGNLAGVPTNAKAALDSYLARHLGPTMGLSINSSPHTVVDSLMTSMATANETVQADGLFDEFISTQYGKHLPAADPGNETIPETWVGAAVV